MTAFLIALGVATMLIAVFATEPLRRRWRRRRVAAMPFPSHWERILEEHIPVAVRMPRDVRRQWREAIKLFLAEKRFVGCGGLVMTEEIRLTIAGQACLLILNRPAGCYEDVRWILVYPSAFLVRTDVVDEAGVQTVDEAVLTGESWDTGRVIVSWEDVRRSAAGATAGENVVLHEFAHQLDQESGDVDGAPLLHGHARYDTWAAVLGREYQTLREKAVRGDPSVLDHYGASDPGEFFAVATEAFFTAPEEMQAEHPELYGELCSYYRVDPAHWHG